MPGSQETIAEDARRIATEVVSPMGLEVVQVVFHRQGKHTFLRIDIDRPGPSGVSLQDCERASREIGERIDGTDLISGPYELQLSSPGVDRPIVSDDDVRRNTGRRVVIEASDERGGSSVLRGTLLGEEGDGLKLRRAGGEEILVPRRLVRLARQDVDADLHSTGEDRRSRGRRDRRGIVGGPSS